MKKKTVGMIPIKLTNQRLPGKNTMMLGDKPLCRYLFDTLTQAKVFDEIYVFCSDEAIKEYIPEGITFLKRPAELDAPLVKGLQILSWFTENVDADVYALMHVTQPFITLETIETSVSKVVNEDYDSAFAGHEMKEYMWYDGKPVNYTFEDIVRTQDLIPVYVESELFVFEKEVFTKHHRRIGFKPYIHPIDWKQAVAIDTIDDFRMAQAVIALEQEEAAK